MSWKLVAVKRSWVPEWLWKWFCHSTGAWPLPWLSTRWPVKQILTCAPPEES